MFNMDRRSLLKGGSALTLAAALTPAELLGYAKAWAADMKFKPEEGAELRLLRWKRFIQSEEDAFLALMDAFSQATGVKVSVESEFMDDIQPKASVAANVGSGPDLIWGLYSTAHLFPDKLIDLTDVADHLGGQYGGWVPAAETYGKGDAGRWINIPICFGGNYLNYRNSMIEKAGFKEVPNDLEGFLEMSKALKANGTPMGMALGHASGDGNAWTHWALWAHDAYVVDENDKVILDSPEAVKACEYVKALYDTWIPGTASWNDGSNNKAFLSGEVSVTNNGISIYQKALTENMTDISEDMDHAFYPVGVSGKPTELHVAWSLMAFKYSKYPNACKALFEFILSKPQYDDWLVGSVAYLTHPLNGYDDNPIWTSDPKRTIFRDCAKRTLTAGGKGSVGERAAAALADFIVVDMLASAATGQTTPEEAVKQATRKAKRIYRS